MSSDLNSGYSDITLDELIDMAAEQYSLSKERKEFIRLFVKSSHSQREEIILHLADLGFRVLMESLENE